MTTSKALPVQSVRTSGWYPCADGTIAGFRWIDGVLVEVERVANWAEVAKLERAGR